MCYFQVVFSRSCFKTSLSTIDISYDNEFYSLENESTVETYFLLNGFALRLVSRQLEANITQKQPIIKTGLKKGRDDCMFWSELRTGFHGACNTLSLKLSGNTLPQACLKDEMPKWNGTTVGLKQHSDWPTK